MDRANLGAERTTRRNRGSRLVATCVAAALTLVAVSLAATSAVAAPKESPRKAPTGRAFYTPPTPLPVSRSR